MIMTGPVENSLKNSKRSTSAFGLFIIIYLYFAAFCPRVLKPAFDQILLLHLVAKKTTKTPQRYSDCVSNNWQKMPFYRAGKNHVQIAQSGFTRFGRVSMDFSGSCKGW